MMRSRRRPSGFTLVEMVISIVILGAIAALLTVFLQPALSSFTNGRLRAALVAEADQALRRISREVKSAVPNSLRSPSASCFELVPTITGGRYRMAPETSSGTSAWVDAAGTTASFDVLTPMATLPAVGDWVVVDNQNAADVYSGSNRTQVTAVSTPAATDGEHRIAVNAMQFPLGYADGRFTVVPNAQEAVFYVCSGASTTLDANGDAPGTLVRLKQYGFNAAMPGACPAITGGDVVARNVRSCRFLYDPNQGATQQSGFLAMQLELTRNNETASLSIGAHVINVP